MIDQSSLEAWRVRSATRAAKWLNGLLIADGQFQSEQKLSLLLCAVITGRHDLRCAYAGDAGLGVPTELIFLERADLQHLLRSEMRKISICELEPEGAETRGEAKTTPAGDHVRQDESLLTDVLGGLGLAYAAEGDTLTVSLLLGMSFSLGFRSQWLTEAELYLLYQQHPAGYFGFFGKQLDQLQDERSRLEARLLITGSALWALALAGSISAEEGASVDSVNRPCQSATNPASAVAPGAVSVRRANPRDMTRLAREGS
jgi:hypothetical protein